MNIHHELELGEAHGHGEEIVEELVPHYGADCPIAVVHRASWPDQDWVQGTLPISWPG